MRQKDQNKVGMGKTVKHCLHDNQSIVDDYKVLGRYAVELDTILADADEAISGQTATSTGVTKDKDALELEAVDAVVSIGSAAKSHALDTANNTLLADVDYGKDALLHIPQNELPKRLRSVLDAAHEVKDTLTDFDVEDDDFTGAYALVKDFEEATPLPRVAIAEKSAVTQSVPGIMKSLRTVLLKMDALMERLKRKYPQFAAAYRAARVVVDSGTRHRRMEEEATVAESV